MKNRNSLAAMMIVMMGISGCGQSNEENRDIERLSQEASVVEVSIETESLDSTNIDGESLSTFFSANDVVYVMEENVNLRRAASKMGEVARVLEKGSKFQRTGYNDTWSRVSYEGEECYIASEYVTTSVIEQEKEKIIVWDSNWKYADASAIHSSTVTLYYGQPPSKGKIVCVNAGHGTIGGSDVKTLCHPDGSPKVTSGSTEKGATKATAVAYGTTMNDGTPEYKVTLKLAMELKKRLLDAGYHVLMIRETDDVQLDNIARTVIANQYADCHISLHYDSTKTDKGAFYMSVPNVESYRKMEPVASCWQEHNRLGESLIEGLKSNGIHIFSNGAMEMDLTQTSYSMIPSVDLEVGDRASDYKESTIIGLASGILSGVDIFFEQ